MIEQGEDPVLIIKKYYPPVPKSAGGKPAEIGRQEFHDDGEEKLENMVTDYNDDKNTSRSKRELLKGIIESIEREGVMIVKAIENELKKEPASTRKIKVKNEEAVFEYIAKITAKTWDNE